MQRATRNAQRATYDTQQAAQAELALGWAGLPSPDGFAAKLQNGCGRNSCRPKREAALKRACCAVTIATVRLSTLGIPTGYTSYRLSVGLQRSAVPQRRVTVSSAACVFVCVCVCLLVCLLGWPIRPTRPSAICDPLHGGGKGNRHRRCLLRGDPFVLALEVVDRLQL